jgi:hypothetical protein
MERSNRRDRFALWAGIFVGGLVLIVIGILVHRGPVFVAIAVGVLGLVGYGGGAIRSVRQGQALRRAHAESAQQDHTAPPSNT